MTVVTEKQACRSCGTKFSSKVLLNFGDQAIVDFLEDGQMGRGIAPLQLVQCVGCTLVQLRHTVDADTLYKKFWYRSSINEQMRWALSDVVRSAKLYARVHPGDFVCDIGSNDGELLLNYEGNEITKVGFEPAEQLAAEAAARFRKRCDSKFEIIPSYFNAIEALAVSRQRLYKIVTAVAMFYDLDRPTEFLLDVKSILHPQGVFVVQMNYLGLMVRNLAFDNVGHEHLCYYSLAAMEPLFKKVGLGIVAVKLNEVNGGSLRVYAMHSNMAEVHRDTRGIQDLLMQEAVELSENRVKNFAERSEATAKVILSFLKKLKENGKRVYAYGASTRGMTLLQTVFKGEKAADYIIAVAERDEQKYGKKMAGLDLKIVPEVEARKDAHYMLVLPYHFWQSIREREKLWMIGGGRFILPLPYPKVMSWTGLGPVASDFEQEEALKV